MRNIDGIDCGIWNMDQQCILNTCIENGMWNIYSIMKMEYIFNVY